MEFVISCRMLYASSNGALNNCIIEELDWENLKLAQWKH